VEQCDVVLVFHHPSLFHSSLKTFLVGEILPIAAFLFFFTTDSTRTVHRYSEHIRFLLFSLFSVFRFLAVGSARPINLTRVGIRAHVRTAPRISHLESRIV